MCYWYSDLNQVLLQEQGHRLVGIWSIVNPHPTFCPTSHIGYPRSRTYTRSLIHPHPVTSHIPKHPYRQHPTSLISHIPCITHPKHSKLRIFHIPKATHFQHSTSKTSHNLCVPHPRNRRFQISDVPNIPNISNIPHPHYFTWQTFHILKYSDPDHPIFQTSHIPTSHFPNMAHSVRTI